MGTRAARLDPVAGRVSYNRHMEQAEQKWLVRNALVVTDGGVCEADVRIENGRIVAVGTGLKPAGAEMVDAAGRHLLPGLIDDQVHFREPGMVHKGDIATESAAAVAGGVTSYMEMPNTDPPTVSRAALADKLSAAREKSSANYAFYLGANGRNSAELRTAAEGPACGIKVFLGASTGNLLVEEEDLLEEVFAAVPSGMVLAAHCEDAARIRARQERILEKNCGNVPMRMHPMIRDRVSCLRSTQRAIRLARTSGTRLHVLHLSTAQEAALFVPGEVRAKHLTCEACLPHLWFCADEYDRLGGRIKCNPAIKEAADRNALRAAAANGSIDVIATDHAPHLLSEKSGSYAQVAAGLPQVEYSLQILLALVAKGVFSLPQAVRLACHNPALIFGVRERGFIREGFYADLALVDMNGGTRPADKAVRSVCGWTPFAGCELPASVDEVWVSGRLAVRNGQSVKGVRGMPLEFDRGGLGETNKAQKVG